MKRRVQDSVVILTPKGYLTGGDETDELLRQIESEMASGNKALLINLAETNHLNQTALGVLARIRSMYVGRGGMVKLCSVDKRIESLFIITKLSIIFDVYPSEQLAIASFSEARSV